jgi:hypothetical protein
MRPHVGPKLASGELRSSRLEYFARQQALERMGAKPRATGGVRSAPMSLRRLPRPVAGEAVLALALLVAACRGSSPAGPAPVESKLARPAPEKDAKERYPIVLARPQRVGDAYRRTMKVEVTVGKGSATMEKVDRREGVSLDADEEVLAVDARGRWMKLRLRIRSASLVDSLVDSHGEVELFSAGAVVTIGRERGDVKAEVTSSAGEVTAKQRGALWFALNDGLQTENEDELFGTREPRAVGESWKVASARLAKGIQAPGILTSVDPVQGETTLVALRTDRGVPCMETATHLVSRFTLEAGPAQLDIEAVTDSRRVLPLDVRAMPHSGKTTVTSTTVLRGASAGTTPGKQVKVSEYAFEPL